jgi:succinyl-diaminopimelate desuccinylase
VSADLLALSAELVAQPSLSHHEAALADRVEQALRACDWLEVERIGDNVLGRTQLGRQSRVLLAGHLDTVPAADNADARLEGDVLWGLGAADMKGGLAVMLDLATSLRAPAVDVTWCFYACEEVGRDHSGLRQVWDSEPDLLIADVAILGEPTACRVEAGCQGTVRVAVELCGVRAHTARPFTGVNAIHRAAPVLTRVAEWEGRSVTIDGCEFVEQLQVVSIAGGVAGNVVPDIVTMKVNHRFAPDRGPDEAVRFLEALFADVLDFERGDQIIVEDIAAGAPPELSHPILAELVRDSGDAPRAKVGWTDVASFWEHGIPATNFGPGDPLLAHHPDERVERAALERASATLSSLLAKEL